MLLWVFLEIIISILLLAGFSSGFPENRVALNNAHHPSLQVWSE